MLFRKKQMAMKLPQSGLRLGVVADTHSKPHKNAIRLLTQQKPDVVLHAGDIGDLSVLDALEDVAPLVVVRGNIDTRAPHLPDAVTIHASSEQASLTIVLTHIAVARSRLRAQARELAQTENADLLICGHSHVPLITRDGDVAVFNPGSIGPRRFALPITFGVVDISPNGVKMSHIDCETGTAWHP